jgi:hypothetical protein
MKTCPYCGKEYTDDIVVCPLDQSPLATGISEKDRPVSSQPGDKGIAAWKKYIIFIVVATSLAYFIFPFAYGFCNLSQGYLMLLAPVMLLGWPVAGIVVGTRMRNVSSITRFSVALMTILALFALFFLFPAGAKTWTLGFSANFRLTKNPAQIQQWANGVLDRYENGGLVTTTNIEYWVTGRDKLADAEIPPAIRKLWWNKPSIGIATITENGWIIQSTQTNSSSLAALTGGIPTPLKLYHCVAFSWYETGILVGRPDFHSKWNPWYLHEIMPGIYAFCGQK